MTTGAQHSLFESTRLVSTQDLADYFKERLDSDNEVTRRRVWPSQGIFNGSISFDVGVADQFGLVEDVESTDGNGKVIRQQQGTDDCTAVPFENTAATDYHVGLRSCRRPVGIQVNGRTGQPEYIRELEDVGEQGDPDSVTDNGDGTITFSINSLAESNHDHSGRTAVVYKKVLARGATTEAVAIESLTVAYSAPNNTITTTAAFGQDDISTLASDYTVVLLGPTVRRDEDLSVASNIVYVGTVTGGGAGLVPSGSDVSAQNDIDVDLSQLNDILNNFTGQRLVRASRAGQRDLTSITERYGCGAVFYSGTNEMYVFGGDTDVRDDPGNVSVNSEVDAYNPATDTWASRTAIPSQSNGGSAVAGRLGARAVELDGLIYLMGGNDGTADYELCQSYNPETDTWNSPIADLPAVRSHGCVAAIGGFVYYAGGFTTNMSAGADNCYRYDPDLDTWTEVAGIDTAFGALQLGNQAFAVAPSAAGDERLYIFGGYQPAGGFSFQYALEYNPTLNQWTRLEDVPRTEGNARDNTDVDIMQLEGAAAATVNGAIHIFGGLAFNRSDRIRKHLVYNPRLDEYSALNDMATPAIDGHIAVADELGTIFVGFGRQYASDISANPTNTDWMAGFDASQIYVADNPGIAAETGRLVERANAGSETWQTTVANGDTVAPLPRGVWEPGACVKDRVMYVSGGIGTDGSSTDGFWAYYPDINVWVELASMDEDLFGHGLLPDDDSNYIYRLDGQTDGGSNPAFQIQRYSIDRNEWEDVATSFGSDRIFASYAKIGNRIYKFGGCTTAAGPQTTAYVYDLLTSNTDTLSALPSARAKMNRRGIVYGRDADGKHVNPKDSNDLYILMLGGYSSDASDTNGGWLSYDVGLDQFFIQTGATTFPDVEGHAAEAIHDEDTGLWIIYRGPGRFYDIGGVIDLGVSPRVYDADQAASYGDLTNPSSATCGYAMGVIDGRIYVFGGEPGGNHTDHKLPISSAAIVATGEVYHAFSSPARPESGLENLSGYNLNRMRTSGSWTNAARLTNKRKARRVRRDTVAFNTGDVWGLGTWDAEVQVDVVKQGEE